MKELIQTQKVREVLKLWPDVGRDILGIGRNQTYDAAHRGEIPTFKIGKRILVSRRALERMLEGAGGPAA